MDFIERGLKDIQDKYDTIRFLQNQSSGNNSEPDPHKDLKEKLSNLNWDQLKTAYRKCRSSAESEIIIKIWISKSSWDGLKWIYNHTTGHSDKIMDAWIKKSSWDGLKWLYNHTTGHGDEIMRAWIKESSYQGLKSILWNWCGFDQGSDHEEMVREAIAKY